MGRVRDREGCCPVAPEARGGEGARLTPGMTKTAARLSPEKGEAGGGIASGL
jgi:hypothetical protein